MKLCELQNYLAANNEEWEVGMKLLTKCPNTENSKFIPQLISLCVRKNQIMEAMKHARD